MIQEILDEKIAEVSMQLGFELSEFQLGEVPMNIFIREMRQILHVDYKTQVSISTIHSYKGVPIKPHHSHDAIMYCLNIKKLSL